MSMQFQMIARIDLVEQHNGKTYTVVTTPAPDAFSHPARFKLQSLSQFGNAGQSMKITVAISGIVREKQFRDKQTGMQRVFQESDVYLNVVTAEPYVQNNQQASKA